MEILHDLCTVSLICYRINFFFIIIFKFFSILFYSDNFKGILRYYDQYESRFV
jgi:hypothetical protein